MFHFVRQVKASGRSIMFIGHNIHHVFDIADRFVVIDRGKVVARGERAPKSPSAEAADRLHGGRGAARQPPTDVEAAQ